MIATIKMSCNRITWGVVSNAGFMIVKAKAESTAGFTHIYGGGTKTTEYNINNVLCVTVSGRWGEMGVANCD